MRPVSEIGHGPAFTLLVQSRSFLDWESEPFAIGIEEEIDDVEVELERPSSIRGSVFDDQGSPVARAEVLVVSPGGQDSWARGTTDGNGRFLLDRVSPGGYEVLARRFGYVEGRSERIECAAGKELSGIVVKLSKMK